MFRLKFSPEGPDYSEQTLKAAAQHFTNENTKLVTAEKRLIIEIAKLSVYAHERGLFDNLLPQRTWCAGPPIGPSRSD